MLSLRPVRLSVSSRREEGKRGLRARAITLDGAISLSPSAHLPLSPFPPLPSRPPLPFRLLRSHKNHMGNADKVHSSERRRRKSLGSASQEPLQAGEAAESSSHATHVQLPDWVFVGAQIAAADYQGIWSVHSSHLRTSCRQHPASNSHSLFSYAHCRLPPFLPSLPPARSVAHSLREPERERHRP